MAKPVRDIFLDLEKHRQQLEENIEKLRKSLLHWQTLDAEYEGLKEEILATKPEANFQQLITIGREFGGSLVKQDEVDDILGVKSGKLRSASQVTDLLSKRMDYTQQSVKILEKQLLAAENKLAAAIVISTPDVMNEDGLPLTEIFEELDDNGNVISSRLSTPGNSKAQMLEVLEKAGMKNLKNIIPKTSNQTTSKDEGSATVEEIQENTPKAKTPKKGVTFADDIKVNTYERNSRPNSKEEESTKKTVNITIVEGTKTNSENQSSIPAEDMEKLTELTTEQNQSSIPAEEIEKLTELIKEQNQPIPSDAIVPEDESEESAALRREMLKYGMSELGEIGAIVAEINLEEDDTSLTDDEDYDEFDDENEDSDEDDEDQFGRSTGRIVSDKVHRQMKELEERLNARMMQNAGPNGDMIGAQQGATSVEPKPDVEEPMAKKTNGAKKGVRFSDKLDISPPPGKPLESKTHSEPAVPAKSPIGDIVERCPVSILEPQAPALAKKVSRFKSARSAQSSSELSNQTITAPTFPTFPRQPQQPLQTLPLNPIKIPSQFSGPFPPTLSPQTRRPTPTGPKNSIISDIIEHEPSPDQVTEPDELDIALLHKEAAAQYHEMTNRMIHRQGGFLRDDEEYEVDEDGGPKIPVDGNGNEVERKVSRFMAARIARE